MADVKISGLPASTVPLAGTEVLPIVQSGTTKQVSIANVTAGRSVAALSVITPTIQAEAGSAGGTIKNGSGVAQMQWGSGGGSNLSLEVATNINPANAVVNISPTGTGTVAISPATASTMNNVAIGGTTPLAGSFTTVKASTTMGVGAATPSTSGAGITFPATQSASTNANTLDDYEEGTWTPVYEGLGGSIGSTAYSVQAGRYTKIGRTVFATAEIVLTNKGSWTSGVVIRGLPFTNLGSAEICNGSVILGFVDFAAGQLYANPRGTGNNDTSFYIDITSDNADRAILGTAAVANNSIFYFNMTYTVP